MNIFIFIIYTLTSIMGLYFIKIATIGFNFLFIVGIFLYGLGFAIWMMILKTNSLSTAFPIASSMLIVGTQIVGYFLLDEDMRISKIIGISFIVLGIVIIYLKEL